MGLVRVGSGTRVPVPSIYPLTVSGRSLLTAQGTPFYINADAPWPIIMGISPVEARDYLADRAAKGVNTVILQLIEHKWDDNSPAWIDTEGNLPFTSDLSAGNPDFTTPNEKYWSRVDQILQLLDTFGMLALAFPAYLGYQQGDEGWASVVAANGTSRMTTYGTFIGNRYKNQRNILWVMGGDCSQLTPTDLSVHVDNLANAIKAVDSNHLMTAHPQDHSISTTTYNKSWLDINSAYPADLANVSQYVRSAYQTTPTKPTLMIESRYGNSSTQNLADWQLRTEMYQSILGGAVGHVYGNNPTWYFGVGTGSSADSAAASTKGLDWHTQLNSFAAPSLAYVRRLQLARNLSALTPDYSHVVVTGTFTDGDTYRPVAANSQMLVAYTNGVALVVDKTQFTSATFNVNWYNVRDGSTTSGGTTSMGAGTQTFTPPTTGSGNDWVLLLDDQALSLSNP